jgi:filamentous hemagglutinin family protein
MNKFFLFSFSVGMFSIFGNPEGPQVIHGDAHISSKPGLMEIKAADQTIINWEKFSIQNSEITQFNLNQKDRVLNRVVGQDITEIHGLLQSKGKVYLINPNGMIIGKEGVIDVGDFIGSTQSLSDLDFLNGSQLLFKGDSEESIINLGRIQTQSGDVLLVAHRIRNEGDIEAQGNAQLAAGYEVLYKPHDKQPLKVLLASDTKLPLIENLKSIKAKSQESEAILIEKQGGKLIIGASQQGLFFNQGSLAAETVEIAVSDHYSSGSIKAENIDIHVLKEVEMTSSFFQGDNIVVSGKERLFTSGTITGNKIELQGEDLAIVAATIDASSPINGGSIIIGGEVGQETGVSNKVLVNHSSTIKANALNEGVGGKIILYSMDETVAQGSIYAEGISGGGFIEISSKDKVSISGKQSATSLDLQNGTILFDPKNITVSLDSNANYPAYEFVSPSGSSASAVVALSSGNVVITYPTANSNLGQVCLFNGTTGGLISTLAGSNTNDQLGNGGVVKLTNGNYVIRSLNWNGGLGAATWGDGAIGISGGVNDTNSLLGSTPNDQVGSGGITALTNGNYVVASPLWDQPPSGPSPLVVDIGAVTWCNGTTGRTGTVSSLNSLVGSTANNRVGSGGVTALTNGDYVVASPLWDQPSPSVTNVGAVTWCNGTTVTTGTVSSSNSLVGSTALDQVGSGGITALTNGNYVVASPLWDQPPSGPSPLVEGVGAVTWGNGTNGKYGPAPGVYGAVSASNSLVGSTAADQVGSGGVTALTNGNYVVASPFWDQTAPSGFNFGAVTWGDGTNGKYGPAGVYGPVSTSNSLVGSTASDQVGSGGVTALTNGNYVVASPVWGANNVGAVTWGDGTNGKYGPAGVYGPVSTSNSLVGSTASDQVGSGGVTALTNGNYVVASPLWDQPSSSASNVGAVTWCDGTTGRTGTVDPATSLVGSTSDDNIGSGGVTALTNGHYVVASPFWDQTTPSTVSNVGAVTWCNGTTVTTGTVSSFNSLVGSISNDRVGSGGVAALINGNYVVSSPLWDQPSPSVTDAGAVTWCNGATGSSGTLSYANSYLNVAGGTGSIAIVGNSNDTSIFYRQTGNQKVFVGLNNPSSVNYDFGSTQNMVINSNTIQSLLQSGNNVTLQANNDITISSLTTTSGTYTLNLSAGRSINLTSINLFGGNLNATSNVTTFDPANRDPGEGDITLTSVLGNGILNLQVNSIGGTAGAIKLNGTTNAQSLLATSPQITLTADSSITTSAALSLNGPVDGAYNLSLNASGALTLANLIGNSTRLTSLSATGATVSLPSSINTTGNISINGTPSLVNDPNLSANAGNISFGNAIDGPGGLTANALGILTFNGNIGLTNTPNFLTATGSSVILPAFVNTIGNISISGSPAFSSTSSMTTTSGDISFNSAIDGSYALTLNAAGAVNFGNDIGSSDILNSLSVTGYTISLPSLVKASNNIYMAGVLSLENDPTINSTTGNIQLVNAINSSSLSFDQLTLDGAGDISFAEVGVAKRLASLSVKGLNVNLPTIVNTTGNISIIGTPSLSNNPNLSANAGNITFANPINGPGSLTANASGTLTFSGLIGGGTPLNSLTLTGSLFNLPQTITADGKITLNSMVTLSSATTVTSNYNDIEFGGTVSGFQNLTLSASSGSIILNGNIGSSPLMPLTPLTGLILEASNITLPASTATSGNIMVDGALILTNNPSISASAGNITFTDVINGTGSLTANASGTLTFESDIGSSTRLTSLSATGSTIDLPASVKTVGNLTLNGTLDLSNDPIIDATSGAITFASAINSTSVGSDSLTVNTLGVVSFNGNIGSTNALAALTVTGNAINLPSSIATDTEASFSGASLLHADTEITSADVTFIGTINNGYNLNVTATGTCDFQGNIGTSSALTSLTVLSLNIELPNSIVTSGDIDLNGTPNIHTSATLTSNAGDVSLANAVNGLGSLSLYADGEANFSNVGDLTPLTSFLVNADTINLSSIIKTTGNITLQGAAILSDDTVFETVTGHLITEAIDGNYALTVDTGSGNSTFGAIGFNTALTSFNVTSKSIQFNSTAEIAGDLTLQPLTTNTDGIPNGFIKLYGSSITADNISLSPVGRGQVVKTATIYGNPSGSNLEITAENITVGPYEAITVLGDITLNGSTSVQIGDVIGLNTLSINSPSITIDLRGPGLLLDAFGTTYTSDTTHLFAYDSVPSLSTTPIYNPLIVGAPDPEIAIYQDISKEEWASLLVYDNYVLNFDFGAPINPPIPVITKEILQRAQTISAQNISSQFQQLQSLYKAFYSSVGAALNGIHDAKKRAEFNSDAP